MKLKCFSWIPTLSLSLDINWLPKEIFMRWKDKRYFLNWNYHIQYNSFLWGWIYNHSISYVKWNYTFICVLWKDYKECIEKMKDKLYAI